jgi:hypothetical protein
MELADFAVTDAQPEDNSFPAIPKQMGRDILVHFQS